MVDFRSTRSPAPATKFGDVKRMGTIESNSGDPAALRRAHSYDSYFYFWRFS
jgi:hypothetical protein